MYLSNEHTAYEYDLSGRLISESRREDRSKTGTKEKELTYLYEGSEIIGLVYTTGNSTGTYYYDKNPWGDVIGILDSAGNTVVKYKYDAYGNCVLGTCSNLDLANTNPIRYRSYYFDADTGLYYLEARYYSPSWRRFISPDSSEYLDPDSVNGLNLYCYCSNDPVNLVDPSGCFAISALVVGLIVGAVIGFGGTMLADYADDGQIFNGSISAGGYIVNTLVGAAFGGVTGGFASSTFSFAIPTFSLAQTSIGTTALVVSASTVTIDGAVVAAAGVLGLGFALFASNNRPHNNRVQNKQFHDAARKAGYNPNDPKIKDELEQVHRYIRDNKLNLGWQKLVNLIKEWLG